MNGIPARFPVGRRLRRSRTDRVLGGVCGGLAEYSGVDANLIRAAFAILAALGVGMAAYIVLWLFVPEV